MITGPMWFAFNWSLIALMLMLVAFTGSIILWANSSIRSLRYERDEALRKASIWEHNSRVTSRQLMRALKELQELKDLYTSPVWTGYDPASGPDQTVVHTPHLSDLKVDEDSAGTASELTPVQVSADEGTYGESDLYDTDGLKKVVPVQLGSRVDREV